MPRGSCIIPDIDSSFPEETISKVYREVPFLLVLYYTPSGKISNFQVLDSRATRATNSKCKKVGVPCWFDPCPPGSGPIHCSFPLPWCMLQEDSSFPTHPTTGPLNLLFPQPGPYSSLSTPSPTNSCSFFEGVQEAVQLIPMDQLCLAQFSSPVQHPPLHQSLPVSSCLTAGAFSSGIQLFSGIQYWGKNPGPCICELSLSCILSPSGQLNFFSVCSVLFVWLWLS